MKRDREVSGAPGRAVALGAAEAPAGGAGRRRGWLAPLALACAAVAVSLPLVRLWPPFPDEGAMLVGAVKLLRGGVFFREVDAFPLPGAWYLLAGAMAIFGQHLITARALEVAIYTGMVVVSFLAVRSAASSRVALLYGFSLIALKYWAWPIWTTYVYPDLAIALAMAGVLVFVRSLDRARPAMLGAAGFLFVASAWCKQTVGVYPGLVGLGLLLARSVLSARGAPAWSKRALRAGAEDPRPYAPVKWYALGGIAALAMPLAYFAAHGLAKEFAVNALVRPFTDYLPLSGLPYTKMLKLWEFGSTSNRDLFPYITPMSCAIIYTHLDATGVWLSRQALATEAVSRAIFLVIPLAFGLGGALIVRSLRARAPSLPRIAPALALYLLAAGIFFSAFPRADYPHVINVAPAWLAVLFVAGDLVGSGANATRRRQRLTDTILALGVVAALVAGVVLLVLIYRSSPVSADLPGAGRVRSTLQQEQVGAITRYIRARTKPADPLFVLGHEAFYYFLCDRYSPWPFAQVFPGQTGAGAGRELADAIERLRIRYVIKGDTRFPGLPPIESYAPSLMRYIGGHYREVDLASVPERKRNAHVLERIQR